MAMKYGDMTAANCTSCHEVHRILPASEAESSINPQNLGRTCGKCHPAMKGAVSIGKVHVEAKKESSLRHVFRPQILRVVHRHPHGPFHLLHRPRCVRQDQEKKTWPMKPIM